MKRILITGGAGFIGSRLARALLEADASCRIWILDNLHPQVHGPEAAAPDLGPRVSFLRGDVGEAKDVQAAVSASTPELVYHLAAETGTGQSYDEPARYCRVNVMGTTHLVEALRAQGSARRVVLAASRAVYGEGAYRDRDGRECVGQPRDAASLAAGRFDAPLPAGHAGPGTPAPSHAGLRPAPASIYASTKLMQEYVLAQAGEGAPWNAVMLRFQNVYGPGQSLLNPYTGVLSIFARQLLEGKSLAIYEDGDIARDFVFVDDVVDALVRAGDAAVPHGTIVDIGLGQAATILAVAKSLMRALDRPEDAFRITGAFRVGDIRHACADIEAAGRLLGWRPRIGINEGLGRLAQWARAEHASTIPAVGGMP
ncbi:MAG TPA: NAD-dependent epimerase/dehydratase family protein [Ramlibacter sp.]|nr:NAD-dependent epimerase/dehydratase family protein [Ramlibacter sp.]